MLFSIGCEVLARGLHCALAGILFADVLNDDQVLRNVLIAFARLFIELAQVLTIMRMMPRTMMVAGLMGKASGTPRLVVRQSVRR